MTTGSSYIPYGKQTVTEDDILAVTNVLRSSHLTQGDKVPSFENAIANKVKSKYSIAVNSATSALHIACLSLGLTKEDRVWTSPITFVASANCARYCGAEIDFVDIDPDSGLMSIKELKIKLEQAEKANQLPKIIIPVHLCGTSCDMQQLHILAKKYKFYIIEDASHAIGGIYQDFPVGSCQYSDICVFSFHPVKIITTGEGGIATTNNETLAKKMCALRSHGITKDSKSFINDSHGSWYYEQQELGFNYRMTDIQAALGLSQLNRLESIINERHKIYSIYQISLKDLPLRLLSIPRGVKSSLHLAVIRLLNQNKDYHKSVFDNLRISGIGVQLHYIPVHMQPYFQQLGFREGDFINSENYAKSAISIPIYPGLTYSEQKRVIDTIKEIVDR